MDGKTSGSEKKIINGHSIQIHFGIADLLKECDYICNVLPKTKETDNILGGGKLELCQGMNIVHLIKCFIIDIIHLRNIPIIILLKYTFLFQSEFEGSSSYQCWTE